VVPPLDVSLPGESPDALQRVALPLLAWAGSFLPEALTPLVLPLGRSSWPC
jgi:hypothetical protein